MTNKRQRKKKRDKIQRAFDTIVDYALKNSKESVFHIGLDWEDSNKDQAVYTLHHGVSATRVDMLKSKPYNKKYRLR